MVDKFLNFDIDDIEDSSNSDFDLTSISQKDIAIIGMDLKLPLAKDVNDYWENIKNGIDCVRELPEDRKDYLDKYLAYTNHPVQAKYKEMAYLDEINNFDYDFFNISPKEAKLMDPKQRLFLEIVWGAIEDAGYGGDRLKGSRTGVFVGGGMDTYYKYLISVVDPNSLGMALPGNIPSIIAGRVSYLLDLKGPSCIIETACSSSLVALYYACEEIRKGNCQMAIVGSVNVHVLPIQSEKEKIGIESSISRAKTFDDSSDGTGLGEGVIAVLLKPLHKALKDGDNVKAVIKGIATNQDGKSIGLTAPNPESQKDLIIKAWQDANISPDTISYIEAHGTGTKLGDPIEIDGLSRAFSEYTNKKQFCAIGSIKTNIGHLDATAGLAGLAKVILMLKNKTLPPIVHFKKPNSKINFEISPVYINDRLRNWKSSDHPRRCGVSSFGLSGTNAHAIIEEAPVIENIEGTEYESNIFALSTKDRDLLKELLENYYRLLDEQDEFDLRDICYTVNTGRGHYSHRVVIIAKSKEELKVKLKKILYIGFEKIDELTQIDVYYGEKNMFSDNQKNNVSTDKNEKIDIQENNKDDIIVLRNICQLYVRGKEIKWDDLYINENRKRVSLPTYPFRRTRCLLKIPKRTNIELEKVISNQLKSENLVNAESNEDFYTTINVKLKGREDNEYSDIEKKVATVFAAVLDYEEINIYDNIYDLGVDSIISAKIVNYLNKSLRTKLTMADLLNNQDINEISNLLSEKLTSDNHLNVIKKADKLRYYPVTSAQKRVFIVNQLQNAEISYNMPRIMQIEGRLDRDKFIKAFAELVKRHQSLRTSFKFIDGEPVQSIHDYEELDFRVKYAEVGRDNLDEIVKGFIRPFDLSTAPLMRVNLLKISEDEHIFLFDIHHIISDGASMNIITKDFIELYQGKQLKELNVQYSDFAVWQKELFDKGIMQEQEKYWLDIFSGEIPVLNLATDHPRPKVQSFEGDRVIFELDEHLTGSLKNICKETRTTLYMILLAVYNILLAKHTGKEDIIVGTAIAGRKHADLENIIGMFVNYLAMRNYPQQEKRFRDFLIELKANTLAAYENQDYQFEELINKINLKRDLSRNPLFDTMFLLQNNESTELEIDKLKFSPYQADYNISKLDLIFEGTEIENKIIFQLEYATKLFKKQTIEGLSNHIVEIIKQIIHNVDITISEIEILTKAEREKILNEFNDTKVKYPKIETIHQVFEKYVEKVPNKIAVECEEEKLTYKELNRKSNQLARKLRQEGVTSEKIVGILVDRSLEMIIGIIAILKAGGTYLPIDPEYPSNRIDFMLEDSEAHILLTKSKYRNILYSLQENKSSVIYLDEENFYNIDGSNLENINSVNDLAYIIYTSGTTGNPKGVMIEHQNVVKLFFKVGDVCNFNTKDVWTMFHSFCFDFSVWEMYGALLNGCKLIIVSKDTARDTSLFLQLLEDKEVTVVNQTPSALYSLIEEKLRNKKKDLKVKYVISGGEALSNHRLEQWREKYPQIKLINMYGPAEATVWSTLTEITNADISIGKPLLNTKIYIINTSHQLQPIGVPGELCIAGDGLAKGYLKRPELTAEKFIDNPFGEGKLYKTGDLARWLPDGNIEYLGRTDKQVKIRGFRIETDEIENYLVRHKNIKEAVVVPKGDDINKYLVAYLVFEQDFSITDVRDYLLKELPEYMIPSYFIPIEKIPLTSNGKLNIKALPKIEGKIDTGVEYVAPRNEIEKKLVKMWEDILGIEKIGINDSFFELGGNSLILLKIVAKIREELDVEISLTQAFKASRIKELAPMIIYNSTDEDHDEGAVLLNDLKSKNVFCFPGIPGYGVIFREMATLIEDYSIYAFNYIDSQDIIQKYIKEIVEIQKEEPYILLGHSAGGNLAFAVGEELERQGYKVSDIILLDTYRNKNTDLSEEDLLDFEERLNDYLAEHSELVYVSDVIVERSKSYYKHVRSSHVTKKVNADLHFISASDKTIEEAEDWNEVINGNYLTYMGSGEHNAMLFDEYLGDNVKIIQNILK